MEDHGVILVSELGTTISDSTVAHLERELTWRQKLQVNMYNLPKILCQRFVYKKLLKTSMSCPALEEPISD